MVRPRDSEDRLRDQLQPLLLQATADASARRDSGRHSRTGKRKRRASDSDHPTEYPMKPNSDPPMQSTLQPYSSYKPTPNPWVGQIPQHWQSAPGKAVYLTKQMINVGMRESTVLSLSYGRLRIRDEAELHGLVPASFETYQIIQPGDIVCRPTDLQNDWNSLRFGHSNFKGIITSAYLCLQTRPGIDPRYGHLLLNAYDLKKVFYGLGSGLRQNLDWSDFKYLLPFQSDLVG